MNGTEEMSVSWIQGIENKKKRRVFIKYDIKDFYPSISEKELFESLKFIKGFVEIPPEQVEIIFHCRISVLF